MKKVSITRFPFFTLIFYNKRLQVTGLPSETLVVDINYDRSARTGRAIVRNLITRRVIGGKL